MRYSYVIKKIQTENYTLLILFKKQVEEGLNREIFCVHGSEGSILLNNNFFLQLIYKYVTPIKTLPSYLININILILKF